MLGDNVLSIKGVVVAPADKVLQHLLSISVTTGAWSHSSDMTTEGHVAKQATLGVRACVRACHVRVCVCVCVCVCECAHACVCAHMQTLETVCVVCITVCLYVLLFL